MEAALERAEMWWESPEVDQLGPDALSVRTFFLWMRQHCLGRKRILDTLLASTVPQSGSVSYGSGTTWEKLLGEVTRELVRTLALLAKPVAATVQNSGSKSKVAK